MLECKDCEYFDGYDGLDGTPDCSYEGVYEHCPFNDYESVKKTQDTAGPFQIIIDGKAMEEYVKHTVSNTVENEAARMAEEEIKKMISDKYQDIIDHYTESEVKKQVEIQVSAFMAGEITVGGGWGEPARTLSREDYLNETVSKQMEKGFEKSSLEREINQIAEKAISGFSRTLRDSVNQNVKACFDEITRKTLTDNVVNMLMSSDTYKTLAYNMGNLLTEK